MSRNTSSRGIAHLGLIIAIVVVIAAVAFGGWYVWDKNRDDQASDDSSSNTSKTNRTGNSQSQQQTDPFRGWQVSCLSEWNVRFELPTDLRGKVSYSLGEAVTDPDGNRMQAAKLLLKNDPAAGNQCAIVDGSNIDIATQVLRVEKDKPFDTTRYKGTFKSSVLTDDSYVYHLNARKPG